VHFKLIHKQRDHSGDSQITAPSMHSNKHLLYGCAMREHM